MGDGETERRLGGRSHGQALSVLARAERAAMTRLAEDLIGLLGDIEVVTNQTGLAMLPMTDTARGTDFHVGEVLVSEAHIRASGQEGYGMIIGRDLEQAMAMAVVDLAGAASIAPEAIEAFIADEAARQTDEDRETLRRVEATRVAMETF